MPHRHHDLVVNIKPHPQADKPALQPLSGSITPLTRDFFWHAVGGLRTPLRGGGGLRLQCRGIALFRGQGDAFLGVVLLRNDLNNYAIKKGILKTTT